MFDDVMGIKGLYSSLPERELCTDVGPDVDFSSEEISVNVSPTIKIIALARS
jgi:hypothetical protein